MQCPGREFHGRWAASPQPWTMKGWMWVSTIQEGEVNGLSQKWPLGAYVTWLYCGGKKPSIYSAQIEGTDKWKKKSIRGPPGEASSSFSVLSLLLSPPPPHSPSSHFFIISPPSPFDFPTLPSLSPPSPLQATELVERCCLGLPHLSSALPC